MKYIRRTGRVLPLLMRRNLRTCQQTIRESYTRAKYGKRYSERTLMETVREETLEYRTTCFFPLRELHRDFYIQGAD